MNRISQVVTEVIVQDTGGASRVSQTVSEVVLLDKSGANRVSQVVAEIIAQDYGFVRATTEVIQLLGSTTDGRAEVTQARAYFVGEGNPSITHITHEDVQFIGEGYPSEAHITSLYVQVLQKKLSEIVPGPGIEITSCICSGLTSQVAECIGPIVAAQMGCNPLTNVLPERTCIQADGTVCVTRTIEGPSVEESLSRASVTHMHVQMLRARL